MNAFQKRIFKLDDFIEQGTSCYKQEDKGQEVNATKSLFVYKRKTILQSSDGIFRSIYFSRSTKNGPFVQSITDDDVLANNIRHQLGAYVTPSTHLVQEQYYFQAID